MPDSAFVTTERQFIGLLKAGLRGTECVEVNYFTLPSVPRNSTIATVIENRYLPIKELWHNRPDAIIVTGAEPHARQLCNEVYWLELADLLKRAVVEVNSLLLSCLAAHAALQLFDGAKRMPLQKKRTGVFAQDSIGRHRFTKGLLQPMVFPHSRLNDVPTEVVRDAGYRILISSSSTGWTVATRPQRAGTLTIIQGHPEYDASSLLREYRRDVERYLTGRNSNVPILPERCVAPEDEFAIQGFHQRVISEEPRAELLAVLPFEQMVKRTQWPWRQAAVHFYTNWIADVTRPGVSTATD